MSEAAAQKPVIGTETPAGGAGGEAKPDAKPEATSIIAAAGEDAVKPDAAAKPDGAKPDGEAAKPDDKPFAIDVPKDLEKFVNKDGLEKFAAFAKQEGLTVEQANKLAKYDLERSKAQEESVAQTSAKWLDEIKKDPELGGDKFDATRANVSRTFTRFGGPTLTTELDAMGMGNHPGLVRFANAVGAVLAEDIGSIPGAGGGSGAKRESIYDPL